MMLFVGGRFYWLAAALFVLVMVASGIPATLRYGLRPKVPTIPATEQVVAGYPEILAEAADPQATAGTIRTETNFGTFETRTRRLRSSARTDDTGPSLSFQILEPDETLVLPDGRELSIVAVGVMPVDFSGLERGVPAPEFWRQPDGSFFSTEEANELNRKVVGGYIYNPRMVPARNSRPEDPYSHHLHVVLATNKGDLETHGRFGLYDRRRGTTLVAIKFGQSVVFSNPLSEWKSDTTHFYSVTAPVMGVSPNPVDLHLRVIDHRRQIEYLKIDEQTTIVGPQGREFGYVGAWFSDAEAQKSIPLFRADLSGFGYPPYGVENIRETINNMSGGGMGLSLHFLNFPRGLADLSLVARGGGEYPARIRSSFGTHGPTLSFRLDSLIDGEGLMPDEVDHVRIAYSEGIHDVLIQLPDLDVHPPENSNKRTLNEMVLPRIIAVNDQAAANILSSVTGYQMQHPITGTARFGPTTNLEGMTVGELMEALVSGPSSMYYQTISPDSGDNSLALIPRERLIRDVLGPYNWLLFPLERVGWVLLPIFAVLLGVKIPLVVAASFLREALRPRGYGAFRRRDFEVLVVKLGRRAWRLPMLEELAVVPGISVEDPVRLAEGFRRVERLKAGRGGG